MANSIPRAGVATTAAHGVAGSQPSTHAEGNASVHGGFVADLMIDDAPRVGDLGVLQSGTKIMQERLDLVCSFFSVSFSCRLISIDL